MKKYVMIFCFLVFITGGIHAQNVLDGVYVKEHVPTRRVIPYTHLREADVMWSKRIWRMMDLNEKLNLPFKFPLSHTMKDRRNLIDIIHDAAKEGTLTAYSADDDEFTKPLTQAEVSAIGAKSDTVDIQDPTTNEWIKKVVTEEFKGDLVTKFRIKEDWFFDKQRSVMDVRIIGMSPLLDDKDQDGNFRGFKPIYWIYFPEARKIFVNQEVFNRGNDAERRTYDDIFFKRMFSSYIIKESSVYNRRIQDYKLNTLDQLLEAQKIKNDIVNLEHDFWEY